MLIWPVPYCSLFNGTEYRWIWQQWDYYHMQNFLGLLHILQPLFPPFFQHFIFNCLSETIPLSELFPLKNRSPELYQGYIVIYTAGSWMVVLSCVSVYLHTILRNHTAHACDGDTLTIKCPSRTSIAILSAFYGRRVPSQHLCPSANLNMTVEEDIECTSPVAIEVYNGGRSIQILYWSIVEIPW